MRWAAEAVRESRAAAGPVPVPEPGAAARRRARVRAAALGPIRVVVVSVRLARAPVPARVARGPVRVTPRVRKRVPVPVAARPRWASPAVPVRLPPGAPRRPARRRRAAGRRPRAALPRSPATRSGAGIACRAVALPPERGTSGSVTMPPTSSPRIDGTAQAAPTKPSVQPRPSAPGLGRDRRRHRPPWSFRRRSCAMLAPRHGTGTGGRPPRRGAGRAAVGAAGAGVHQPALLLRGAGAPGARAVRRLPRPPRLLRGRPGSVLVGGLGLLRGGSPSPAASASSSLLPRSTRSGSSPTPG